MHLLNRVRELVLAFSVIALVILAVVANNGSTGTRKAGMPVESETAANRSFDECLHRYDSYLGFDVMGTGDYISYCDSSARYEDNVSHVLDFCKYLVENNCTPSLSVAIDCNGQLAGYISLKYSEAEGEYQMIPNINSNLISGGK